MGLVNLMKSSPKSVVDHRELVLRCLNDDDVTIRSRALELLAGIVSRKSLVDLVHHLLEHARHSEGGYRDEIIAKILYMCSKDKYGLVTDFAWYTSILLSLAVMPGSKHGKEVADQLIEISIRVHTVRPYAVESMLSMLMNDSLILGQARATVSEVLKAAAWIVGEYSEALTRIANDVDVVGKAEEEYYWIEGPTGEDLRSVWRGRPVHLLALQNLLHPRATNLPPHVQAAYILSAMKIFLRACSDCQEADLTALIAVLRCSIGVFLQSPNVEVQERASTLRHVLAEFGILEMGWEQAAEAAKRAAEEERKTPKPMDDLLDMPAFSADLSQVDRTGTQAAQRKKRVLGAMTKEPFYAVHSKAQRRVLVPEGLNLDAAFNSAALKALLDTDIPEGLTLQNLWFTDKPPPSAIPDRGPDDDDRIGKLARSTFGIDYATGETKSYASFQGDHSSMLAPPARSAEDNLFYLVGKGGGADAIAPLSQILADTFEDKKVKRKKGDKSKKTRTDEVDTREMLPAGAVDSDDDKDKKGKKKDKARRRGEVRPFLPLPSITPPPPPTFFHFFSFAPLWYFSLPSLSSSFSPPSLTLCPHSHHTCRTKRSIRWTSPPSCATTRCCPCCATGKCPHTRPPMPPLLPRPRRRRRRAKRSRRAGRRGLRRRRRARRTRRAGGGLWSTCSHLTGTPPPRPPPPRQRQRRAPQQRPISQKRSARSAGCRCTRTAACPCGTRPRPWGRPRWRCTSAASTAAPMGLGHRWR